MDPKLECLDINWPPDKVAEHIGRFNFWIDTRGPSDEKAIRNDFLTVVGKEAFSLLRTRVFPLTLRDASVAEIQGALQTSPVWADWTDEVSHIGPKR